MIFKNKKKINLLIIVALVIIVPFISIGYSALSTILNIRSDVTSHHVVLRTEDFPDEIEYLMDNDSCMARYEGEVTDEVNNTVSAKNVYFNKCSDKRNIIFNNICWQMIRTTETGGIKMIYNGEPVNGKCENTRGTHKGIVGEHGTNKIIQFLYNIDYLYGDSFTYDASTNEFTLVDTITARWNDSTYENILGKFTCINTTGTCTNLYNVFAYHNTSNALLIKYTIGDAHYSQIGVSAFNARGNPSMVGYMYNKTYNYSSLDLTSGSLMGNDVSYSNGTYTLLPAAGESELGTTKDSNHHYTCNNTSGTCNEVYFYYDTYNYVTLDGGEKIEDAINNMLYNDNVNRYNSNIKGIIDAWYRQNMLSKTSMLEDTVYCNARTMINQSTNGWNKDGYLYIQMKFKNNTLNNDLSCTNVTDQFAVSNNKAKLTYPIALAADEELYTLTNNNSSEYYSALTNTGTYWWSLSPNNIFTINAEIGYVGTDGGLVHDASSINSTGVRPVISLKSGVEIASGTGSETDPWVVDEREKLHDKIVNLSSTDYLITKYNGDVTDSVGSTTTATKVYFDKHFKVRNVIFGGFCWQIIRTTETGGTKMIYNGEPVDGKCENPRSNHKGVVQTSYYEQTLDSSYLYGSSFTYDTTNNVFALVDTTTATWGSSTYENLIGKFTCKSASNTCSTMYLLNGYKSNTQAYAAAYTVSDTNYAQIGTSSYNANYGSPASVGYMFNKVYNHNEKSIGTNTYKFGNSFTYDSGTNTYTLAGTTQTISDWTTGYNTINNTHYTCWNTTGSCTTISYIDYTTKTKANYFDMSDGKSANDILEEMLVSNDVNRYNSNIKGIVDSWYAQNLLTKTSMLEDIVFCNARNITDYGPWNPDGGNTVSGNMIKFKNYSRTNNLACANLTDQFAVGNNKAKLTYPVGLLQDEERNNPNFVSLWKTGTSWWELSPFQFKDPYAFERLVNTEGSYDDYAVYYGYGVRPVISLKNSVLIASGSGDLTDPWIIQE